MALPDGIRTFPDLIRHLVTTRHEGSYYRVAVRLQVSTGLPYQWRDGVSKVPLRAHLEALCRAYDLDFWDVHDLVHGRAAVMPPTPATRRKPTPIRGSSGAAWPEPAAGVASGSPTPRPLPVVRRARKNGHNMDTLPIIRPWLASPCGWSDAWPKAA